MSPTRIPKPTHERDVPLNASKRPEWVIPYCLAQALHLGSDWALGLEMTRMVLTRPLYCFVLIALALVQPVFGALADAQRKAFLDAEQALQRGDRSTFSRLSSELEDYALFPYLEYQALRARLNTAETGAVAEFLSRYADTPVAALLRLRWLDHLASRKRWSDYLRFYRADSGLRRECHQLHAMIATGQADQALSKVAPIWLHGKSQPRACDPVFAAWTKAGYRSHELTWQRIEKAMEAGQWRLAKYLSRSLTKADQAWLKRWIALYQDPNLAARPDSVGQAHPYREAMLSHATRRLARWNGAKALTLWRSITPSYPFTDQQIQDTEHYILRNLVRTPGDDVYAFIRKITIDTADDIKVHEARIGAALLREDWPQVIRWIAALPQEVRYDERWLYWLGRALEGTGQDDAARPVYRQAATQRSYYGFLAADRIGSEYHLDHAETPASADLVAQIAVLDSVRRAAELFALERWTDARREWRWATRDMDAEQLKAAAKLAEQHGWHDQAIFTLAKTGYWDDLELRFPMAYARLVERNAKRHGIEKAWVFAVMRQESAFMDDARSHAGAMGLMQLMPATARSVARQILKRKPPRRHELMEPDINIALGSAYLKQMKGELGDSAVLATAAYNAGPHRVVRWLPDRTLPADVWIELVPFDETRGYLRRVLAYTVIYEKRMGRTPTRLHKRLHPVPPQLRLLGSARTAQANLGR